MNLVKEKELCKVFVKIGRQQYSLVATGTNFAEDNQGAWNSFVASLLSAKGDRAVETVYEHLVNAVTEYNQKNHPQVNIKSVYNYFTAKILRSISMEPSELEKDWYFVCGAAEIPQPGNFVTIQIFQEPLVAVRQSDGTIRVFLNVCTHRQSPVFEGHGCIGVDKPALCPYHGWAFGIDGVCKNAPGANRGEFGSDFDLKNYSLQEFEVKIDENQGVFAKLGENSHLKLKSQPQNPQNIGVAITNLLNSVSPGYADGETATLPETIRLWLRVGYLEENIKQLIADITPGEISDSQQLILESLIGELKQAILTVDSEGLTLELDQVLQGVYSSAKLKGLMGKSIDYPEIAPDGIEYSESSARRQALPIWIYGDAALFALEVEHLIKPTWQFVCHINEVPQPGNFTWLDIVGERAYVIRTANGELFAGKLQDVTQRRSYPQFGLPNYGLEPIDIDIFYGFIFIRFTWSGSRLAESWYLPNLLAPYQLENMQPIGGVGCYDINVEVDYKLLWENFLEDYHFPMMHKGLTRRFGVSSDCEGINGMIIPMRDPASPSLTPIERQYYDCAKAIASHSWEREQELQDFAAQNHALPETLCYSAFCSMSAQEEIPMPFSLSVFPEHVQAFSLVPAGPRESRFHVRSYGHPLNPDDPNTKAIEAARLANIQLLVESLHEDIRVNYICQDSVSSRLFKKIGVFNIAEYDVAKFQEAIRLKLPITSCPRKPL
ncbi:Rieske 2Fe-2S domain-containing protein [Nodularia sphaerocarpa]|uniref:Rieske 2Fe-2S domain-containing protein n=1 Tax=Nodularia sphaerocarpa TaxID=137816 RepID=UPI001EFB49E1|nr:Rieske 2Fe-2S domain-containing protein [Nodularia sphaerocarpa]MDB9373593.1 Rieske 2Fe-2S domain-containing protein [Nodularia sphaerocarpa CS-585]MDB9378022.1 Rieske 2Fe-2S domain-containing protein [Nodularia sphaerocarpa CS-585A2]ULP74381.1 oxygenase [Nodularia sphaerocarpa UHCC 0038]